MERIFGNTRLVLLKGDVTAQDVDAIVNAANSSLMGGGGVDGAIHRAGGDAILRQCREIVARQGLLPPGRAVITGGGRLAARHVIHTVGPIWRNGTRGESETLADAHRECLSLAEASGLRSVAFPSISTGAYGYPVADAAGVALSAVAAYLRSGSALDEVRFVLFSDAALSAFEDALEALPA